MNVSYPNYKKIELEWLKEIPEHWTYGGFTKFLDSIVDYRGKTPQKVEKGVFLVTARNIKNGIIDYSLSQEFVKIEDYEDIMRRGKPKIGDVLFTTEAPLGEVANIDNENIALAQRVIKFRGIEGILDNYYLKYWLLSHPFQENLKTFATGSTAAGIKASKLSSLQILIPPIKEQREIVEFLEIENVRINKMISLKFKLIELLEEKRQSIITEAVTKGLNSSVIMKDSGVEWISKAPAHWKISKIKQLATVMPSSVDKKSVEGEPEVLLCNYVDVYYNSEINSSIDFMKATAKEEQIEKFTLYKHDVLITKDSESSTDIAIPSWVAEDLPGVICGYHLALIRPSSVLLGHYLYYALETLPIREQFYSQANGVTRFGLGKDAIKNGLIPVPPFGEQVEIATYLYEQNKVIEETKRKIKFQIEKLKEYRQSLIYEAVTGKIDVRELIAEK